MAVLEGISVRAGRSGIVLPVILMTMPAASGSVARAGAIVKAKDYQRGRQAVSNFNHRRPLPHIRRRHIRALLRSLPQLCDGDVADRIGLDRGRVLTVPGQLPYTVAQPEFETGHSNLPPATKDLCLSA